MKPFDFNAAKAGAPLITRSGKEATQFTVFDAMNTPYPCAAVINGMVYTFTVTGKKLHSEVEQADDLFMAPKKRTVWVTLFDDGDAAWIDEDVQLAKGSGRVIASAIPVEIED